MVKNLDTDAIPQEGLPVYVFDGAVYTGYNGVTDANGEVVFTLPQGDYRFRSDRNGTQFWSGGTDHCTIPGCSEASVTMTIPVIVTVQSETGSAYPDLPVYVFDGDSYTGYNGTSDENGQVIFTLTSGDYRFRADYDGVQFWSGLANHCTIPGCLEARWRSRAGWGPGLGHNRLQLRPAAAPGRRRLLHRRVLPLQLRSVGNRLTQDTPAGTNTYLYDIANRLEEVDGFSYIWDDNGNLLEDGVRQYAYDHANRLITVEMGDDAFEFSYNGVGDRLRQTVNGTPTEYTLDLAAGLSQVLSDGENAYLYGVGRIGEQQPDRLAVSPGRCVGECKAARRFRRCRRLGAGLSALLCLAHLNTFGALSARIYGFTGEQIDPTGSG